MIQEAFRLGGFGMYPTLGFGVITIAAAIRYARSRDRRAVPLAICLAALTTVSGVLGFVTGVIKSLTALDGLPPSEHWVSLIGLGESLHNVALAGLLVLIAGMIGAFGAYRAEGRAPAAGKLVGNLG